MFCDHNRIKLEVNKNGNRKISKYLNVNNILLNNLWVKEEASK